MLIAHTKSELHRLLRDVLTAVPRVFVPTMGALHDGHKQLIMKGRDLAGEGGVLVVSLFVNPTQFNNAQDLVTYPKTWEHDTQICKDAGVDILFAPATEDMYAPDASVVVDEGSLADVLCGASRPGHFRGVCTIVTKLFNLVQPTDALFGKKDYQQLAVIRRMVRDLDVPVTLHGVETVREADGLAYSSRNLRLTPEHRAQAPLLYKTMLATNDLVSAGVRDVARLIEEARRHMEALPGVQVDYIALVDRESLRPLETVIPGETLMALAVWFGDVRLIDNREL